MKRSSVRRLLLSLPLALSLALSPVPLKAEAAMSLLPLFGGQGYMFNKQSKNSHNIAGWLPKKWVDNSTWAAVNAVYTQLLDPPNAEVTAVRIDVQAVDEGQLQLTSFEGNADYKQGAKYVITGWVRSAGSTSINVCIRDEGESKEFYVHQKVSGTPEWKPFEVEFNPDQDRRAWLMFIMKEAGAVDLAGIVVTEK